MTIKKPAPIEPGNYNQIVVNPPYNPLQEKLKPLDFFCTQGSGFISWGIRRITKNLSPDRESEFNHVGLFPDGTACTLEALWHLETKNVFEHYEGCYILIGRYINLTPEKYLKAITEIRRHIDQKYPIRRLFLHLLNIAHFIHWTNYLVCSEFVAKALFHAGARGHHYWGTTPDNLADEIEHELNEDRTGPKYEIVYKNKLSWLIYKYCKVCRNIDLVPPELKLCKCKNKYVGIKAIPSKELREHTNKYNKNKMKWINEKLIKK
jgi:hypothetical protein